MNVQKRRKTLFTHSNLQVESFKIYKSAGFPFWFDYIDPTTFWFGKQVVVVV